ncbi:hypothetical protein [Nitrosopumilus ureiphilus]|uniref:Uncharacterized protein n=1 Tax=Nitrosopumilus ureiphilus TaxID=1470067 RepID=A0A7D5MAD8_9ARCH|nr:hypothetical protein [Nitrosopumilus ureiphilus]QLH06929.1 hypothetical protein C5F50_07475 [Nitrosopumilus ureiphilus]
MKKINKLQKQLESVKTELGRLLQFRETSALKKFKRQLEGEKSNILSEIKKSTQTKAEKEKQRQQKRTVANRNRSSKNKRVWNYVKSIQKNYYPKKPLKEIRTSLRKHRQGLDNDVSDVAWRNPSP